jgi:CHAD domain-containing protein/CYTH domain-containing protein
MPTLLDRRPEEATRLLALELLAQADAARGRAADPAAADALHAFRVAIRRLRTIIAAFPRELESSVPRRALRRLRKLARATNEGRDAEVQIAWIDGERGSLYSRHRAGAAWMLERLRARRTTAYGRLGTEIGEDFGRVHRKLTRALATYDVTFRVGDASPPPRFAETVARAVRDAASDLATRLARIAGPDDVETVHRARIAAKRLRYVLEPAAADVPRAKEAVKQLKRLQDVFGEIHDLDVLAEALRDGIAKAAETFDAPPPDVTAPLLDDALATPLDSLLPNGTVDAVSVAPPPSLPPTPTTLRDPRPGLACLARRARAQRTARYGDLAAAWLHGAAADFLALVESAAQAIGAPRDAVDAPPLEIERKYLLRELPPVAQEAPFADIEQGWIPGEQLRERLRRTTRDGADRFFRTVKLGAGVSRTELDEETTDDVFAALWPLTRMRRIAKRRYVVPEGALVWEIDAFVGRELVVAEVELPNADVIPVPPPWLAPYIVRDVTDEPGFTNFELAASPAPDA